MRTIIKTIIHTAEEYLFLGMIFAMTIGMIFAAIVPIAYFMGSANAAWIKETKGVDIPWYQAAFYNVQINEINAEVKDAKD